LQTNAAILLYHNRTRTVSSVPTDGKRSGTTNEIAACNDNLVISTNMNAV